MLISDSLEVFFCDDTPLQKLLGVDFITSWMTLNCLVHEGLCKDRLVLFVVSVPSISYNIDEDVFMEFLSISDGDLHALV